MGWRPPRKGHEPRFLDKVWDEARHDPAKGKNANGYILRVYREFGQITSVVVRFHDDEWSPRSDKTYPVSELDGRYTNQEMGYLLHAKD